MKEKLGLGCEEKLARDGRGRGKLDDLTMVKS